VGNCYDIVFYRFYRGWSLMAANFFAGIYSIDDWNDIRNICHDICANKRTMVLKMC